MRRSIASAASIYRPSLKYLSSSEAITTAIAASPHPPIMPAKLVEAGSMLSKLGWSREESC
jgi:hypothetical protein